MNLAKAGLILDRLLFFGWFFVRVGTARRFEGPASHRRVSLMENALAVLVKNAAAGDEAAMEELLARFEGMMKKAAHQRHLLAVAEDAFAEAQLSFLQAVRGYDAARGIPFEGWAKAKVYGDLRSFFRRERLHWQREVVPEGAAGADELSFWDKLAAPERDDCLFAVRGLLEQAMCILSVKQRRLLELIFFEDKSQKEAAGILGMTQQSAAVLKGRALNRLRQRLYSEGYYVCSGGQGGGTD